MIYSNIFPKIKSVLVVTTEMSGISYNYIKSINPSNILLLCDLNNPTIPLDSVMWRYSGVNYTNPIKLNNLNASDAVILSCLNKVFNDSLDIRLSVYGKNESKSNKCLLFLYSYFITLLEPSLMLSYDGFQAIKYDSLSPDIITLTIPLFSTQVLLSTNFESGIWEYPDSRLVASRNITIPFHTLASGGKYLFNTNLTWDKRIAEVFILNILTSGIYFISP